MSEALDKIIKALQEEAEQKAYEKLADERKEFERAKASLNGRLGQAEVTAKAAQKARLEMRDTLLRVALDIEDFANTLREGLK